MEGYVSITLEVQDKVGKSSLTFEGLEYEEAKNEILGHLNYVYKVERFVTISIEIKDRTKKLSRVFEKVGYFDARNKLDEFLNYVYAPEGEYEGKFEPEFIPAWLGKYNLGDLSQKDKVFILLKHNHRNKWVRSQDLQEEYEMIFGENIKLSSLSTLLARFYDQGELERKGSRAQREYRLPAKASEAG
jgi:hypothetical protein